MKGKRAQKKRRPEADPAVSIVRGHAAEALRPGRIGIVFLLLTLTLAAALAWRDVVTPDFGFNLASGRLILDQGTWPRTDPFTYTVSDRPYLDLSGLFQIVIAFCHDRWGLATVNVLQALSVLAAVGLVWATARRRGAGSPILLGAGFALGVLAWEPRFLFRAELATFVFLAAEIYLLQRHTEDGRRIWLFALVPLQVVWVQCHTLSVLGPVVLGLYAASRLVGPARRDPTPWIALALCLVALLLNPYGFDWIVQLLDLRSRLSSTNVFAETIGELRSPFSGRANRPLWAFRVFFVLALALAASRGRSLRPFDGGLLLLFGALAANAQRNVPFFVIAALPVSLEAAQALGARFRRSGGPERRPGVVRRCGATVLAALLALLVSQVILGGYYDADARPMRFAVGLSSATLPLRTTEFLAVNRVPGPIYNHLRFGGHLLARLWPREKVFIVGQLELVGEEFYKEYLDINRGEGWEAMLRRYDPNIALIALEARAQFQRLIADPAWTLVEVDGVAALFVRTHSRNSAAIETARRELQRLNEPLRAGERPTPRPPASWLARSFGPRGYPWEAAARGRAFFGLGLFEAARREYARGLAEAGRDEAELALGYAAACEQLGLEDEARVWQSVGQRLSRP